MHRKLTRRPLALAGALLALALTATACGGDDGETEDADGAAQDFGVDSLEIVTAPTGSVFYPMGAAIASRLEAELGIPVTAAPSAGSGENVVLMSDGTAQLGIVASNALVPAYSGETPYDTAHETLRPIAHLYPNALLVFALEDSGLKTIKDLEGKRVGVGAEARTWDHFVRPLFEAHGLNYGENMTPVYAGFDDMTRQVRDGQLDAAIATGGANSPSPPYQEIASELDVVVLEWEKDAIDEVTEEAPYMNAFPYPGDLLLGATDEEEYYTADIGGPYLATTSDLSEELVYEITRIFHEELKSIADEVAVLQWTVDQGDEVLAQPLGELPFHDGAIKYWQEIGAME